MLAAFAFTLRLLAVMQGGRFERPEEEWERGYEVGAVAAAIAGGRGFSDPFRAPTGPTAAVGPLVPALWSLPLRVFGITSAWGWRAIVLLDIIALALVVPVVVAAGRRIAGARFGLLCGAAWTIHPLGVMLARGYLGSLAWYTLAVSLVIERILALADADRRTRDRRTAGLAFALGFSLWIEPMLVPFAMLLLAWTWITRQHPHRAAALAVIVAGLLIVPWLGRNARVVGVPTLSSAAASEIWLGALAGPGEATPIRVHPSRNRIELEHLKDVGEARFGHEKLVAARDLILRDPVRWMTACAWRLGNYWFGRSSWWRSSGEHPIVAGPASALRGLTHAGLALLALAGLASAWRSVPATRVFALLFAVYPFAYALTHVEARYRLPLEPALCIAACLLLLRSRRIAARLAEPGALHA
jgi:hypothetical protein